MDTPRLRFKDELGAKFTDWNKRRIKEILTIYNGRDYKDLKYGEYPVLGTGGVITYVDKYLCNWNCACIGRKGTINKPFFMDKPFWCVDTLFYTKPKEKNNPKFQFYLFETIDWQKYNTATGVPSLTGTTIGNINVEIPTIFEQNKIADFLSSYDEKISIQRERVESLERRKKGLLQKVFSQEIRFKAEDGNEFPEWGKKKIEEICSHFKSGKYISASDILPMGIYPVYGGNGIRGYANHFNHNGDYIVIGRQGALCGNVRRISGLNYCTEHAIAVQANSDNCTFFLEYLFIVMRLGQYSDQGAQPGLAVNKLVKLETEVPCLKEQEKIATFFTAIDDQINIERERLSTMETIKKGLLQGLFC